MRLVQTLGQTHVLLDATFWSDEEIPRTVRMYLIRQYLKPYPLKDLGRGM